MESRVDQIIERDDQKTAATSCPQHPWIRQLEPLAAAPVIAQRSMGAFLILTVRCHKGQQCELPRVAALQTAKPGFRVLRPADLHEAIGQRPFGDEVDEAGHFSANPSRSASARKLATVARWSCSLSNSCVNVTVAAKELFTAR